MLPFGALLLAAASSLPQHLVTGRVIDAKTHTAVHGASVAIPNGKRIATTNRAGQFNAEIPAAAWPPTLTITSPGLAERKVELPHVPGNANLKDIALSAESRIHALLPPAFAAETLRWTLYRLVAGKQAGKRAEGQFAHGRADVIIDSLDSDNYVLVISGEGPLQQIATKA